MVRKIFLMLGVIIGYQLFFVSPGRCEDIPTYGGKLKIISPIDGAVFSPGDKVTVKAVYSGDHSEINGVSFITQDMHTYLKEAPPYEYEFTINREFLGKMLIAVSAMPKKRSIDDGFQSDGIEVMVKTKEIPIKITTAPYGPYYLFWPGLEFGMILNVTGIYPDGVERDITLPETGTTYTSSDPSVFEVVQKEKYIVLETKRAGEAKLSITNGITKIIDVYVKPR